MADIEFADVTKRYADGFEAVKRMNLRIEDGEFMILVGPSGCGKSTALRMIAGLEEISDGELSIGGKVVNELGPKERDIAMVFQSYALYPHMTVRENMGFALKLSKVDKDEMNRRVEDAARILDLEQHLDRKPANLSGGQRQRVAMGRAIVREPKAYLMDEPLSNLDAKLRVQMRTEVARIQQRTGTTTVYVTHDQTEALTFANRVVVMHEGRVVQIGTPQELFERPSHTFVGYFIGSPGMNVLPAQVVGAEARVAGGTIPLGHGYGPLAGRVEIGVRPEFVRLSATDGLPVAIRRVEDVGRHRIVRADLDGHLIAIVAEEGETISPDMTRAVFDPTRVGVYHDGWLVEGRP